MDINLELSKNQIELGGSLFVQAEVELTYETVEMTELLGIVAFIHPESGEQVLMQFFQTTDNYFATFLYSGGIELTEEFSFPAFNNTGDYYVLVLFNHPGVVSGFQSADFIIIDPEDSTTDGFQEPTLTVLFQGLIISSITLGLVVFVYFNARRRQEASMHVPELDAKITRDIDNLFMEMQSKLQLISEEILYKKQDDYKVRIQSLEEKINFFEKTVKKMRNFKKRMSKF